MKIKVQFFEERLVDAVGAGVYEIYARTDDKEELFYVGESVFVLVRCATHLYEISKGVGYLGFDEEKLEKTILHSYLNSMIMYQAKKIE